MTIAETIKMNRLSGTLSLCQKSLLMKNLLFLVIFLLFSGLLTAQPAIQWQRTLGGSSFEDFTGGIQPTSDGGYIVAGSSQSNNGNVSVNLGSSDYWIVKLTATGGLEWEKSFGDSWAQQANSIYQTNDGGYIIAGFTFIGLDSTFSADFWIVKLAANGALEWEKSIGGSLTDIPYAIQQTNDGGYIVAGESDSTDGDVPGNAGRNDGLVVKLTPTGEVEWLKSIGGHRSDVFKSVRQTSDGGYILAGGSQSNSTAQYEGSYHQEAWMVKLTPSGDIAWQKFMGDDGAQEDFAYSIEQTSDGGFIAAGYSRPAPSPDHYPFNCWIAKLTPTGALSWQKNLGGFDNDLAFSIQQTSDGGYITAGISNSNDEYIPVNHGDTDCWLVKINETGNIEWQKSLGGSQEESNASVRQTHDGGYIVAASTRSNNFDVVGNHGQTDFWVVKLTFDPVNSALTGYVYEDLESDCLPQLEETPLVGQLVEATGSFSRRYAITDANGHYFTPVSNDHYELNVIHPGPYWQICDAPVIAAPLNDTLTLDLRVHPIVECPYLTVDITALVLRRCFNNTYAVHYCNYGTAAAENAYVEVSLDPYLEYVAATLPVSDQTGNTLRFDLGNVDVNTCGDFQISAYLSCDSTVLGQTHCTQAHIFPDSLCLIQSAQWDGSNIEVEAQCEGDSAIFIIRNIGAGDMSEQRNYIIIEDDIVLMQDDFQLEALQSFTVGVNAHGATFRLEAQQSPNHPAGIPSSGATIEGCNGWTSIGFFNQWDNNSATPFVDTDCQPNIGSFDPNDKTGFPAGFGEQHLIEQNQPLEYRLRFQNTGTDTAFTVRIVDILPEQLDLTTLRPGASSHPYTYSVTPEGQPVFTFDNILLPDSTTNESASHGFINFRIAQQPDLADGTHIANKALIYFDFNAPIETNTTLHQIGKIFPWEPMDTTPVPPPAAKIIVKPNPFTNHTFIQVEGIKTGQLRLALSNTLGQVLRVEAISGTGFEFQRGSLPGGLYFFRVEKNGVLVGSGKLVVQE